MSQAKPSAVGKSRRGIDAPTPARVEDCRSRGRSPSSEGEPTGTGGERKAPCKRREKPTLPYANPCRGLDAPTPARTVGLPPRGGGSTFFRCERKYQRKPAARRLQRRPTPLRVAGFGLREPFGLSSTSVRCAHPPGKSPLLPILTAGLAMSRAMKLDSFHQLLERARARLFPPSKWAGLFPSAAYCRSAPPQLALGRLNQCELGCYGAGWMASLYP